MFLVNSDKLVLLEDLKFLISIDFLFFIFKKKEYYGLYRMS